MTRKMFVAGNWKMNGTYTEAVNLAQRLSYHSKGWDQLDVCVFPPFTALRGVSNVISFDKTNFTVGAQNVYWEKSGAYTGEISPHMLSSLDCEYCIVGHSERREHFHETDQDVNKKIQALLYEDITPVLCVGESLETHESGDAIAFVTSQVRAALEGITFAGTQEIVVAYEPIWAIGTGEIPTPEVAQEVCAAIRETVREVLGEDAAEQNRILYGGSVQPANSGLFFNMPDIDGALVGGASLDDEKFAEIVKEALKYA